MSGVAQAIAYANAQLGKPYQWGGESETNGFDCSGLVQAAYRVAGLDLPRTAAAQYAATSGQAVGPGAQLVVGDLVFFSKSDAGAIHHVGVYVGNGLVLNAPHTGAKVRFDKLSSFPDFYAATRPLADGATVSPAQPTKAGFKLPGSGVISGIGKSLTFGLFPSGDQINSAAGVVAHPVKAAQDAASSAESAVGDAVLSGVQRYVVEAVLLAGGVGLVALGVYKGVKS